MCDFSLLKELPTGTIAKPSSEPWIKPPGKSRPQSALSLKAALLNDPLIFGRFTVLLDSVPAGWPCWHL